MEKVNVKMMKNSHIFLFRLSFMGTPFKVCMIRDGMPFGV